MEGRVCAGYRVLRFNGKVFFIHRIVVRTFSGSLGSAQHVINHKDGIKENNHIDNLEVVTPSENMRHAWGMRLSRDVLAARRPVKCRKPGAETWTTFSSTGEAARLLGTHRERVCLCCKDNKLLASGYECRYADQAEPEELPDEVSF